MQLSPKNVKQLISKLSSAPFVIYGMGYVGQLIAEWCDQNRIAYIFCDRDATQKRKQTDRTVIFPDELLETCPETVVVVASINYQDEIRAQLTNMGIDDNRLLSYLDFWPERAEWAKLESSADWCNVRKRAEIFAAWVDPAADLIADYSLEKNFLRDFLQENVRYESPDYIRFQDNIPYADFSGIDPAFQSDVSSCLAMLMSFGNPEVVIDYLCAHTEKAIIVSYVPVERLSDIQMRRSINYNNDYTEQQLVSAFEARGFRLSKSELDPFDTVHTVYLFEKK